MMRAGSPSEPRAVAGTPLLADFPGTGGRPLRRRRETVLAPVHQRLRGTAALQVSTDYRCHGRVPLLADSLEGYAPS